MKIQAVRGMRDILPAQQEIYRHVVETMRPILAAYGYREIGLPVIEATQLFERLVGEETDIVEKEMYTFDDRNGDSLTLRPEGTAGCARAAQESGIIFNQTQRLWYSGPMFRHERPQKGRYRQFEQIGVECFGMQGPDIDAELLFLTDRLWEALGLRGNIELELNSLGGIETRARYKQALVAYLSDRRDQLDDDSLRRLDTNPLRILDSKVQSIVDLLADAPAMTDFIDDESQAHFDGLRRSLDNAQVPYRVNPRIVRGLDYYNRTVFEWTTDRLGAQGTICAGGRYDGLVEELGGRPTTAVGFAMGLDRIVLMIEALNTYEATSAVDVYIASIGELPRSQALMLAEQLRSQIPDLKVVVHCGAGKLGSQLKKADVNGADLALIIGEDEIEAGEVTVKLLREEADQIRMNPQDLAAYIGARTNKKLD